MRNRRLVALLSLALAAAGCAAAQRTSDAPPTALPPPAAPVASPPGPDASTAQGAGTAPEPSPPTPLAPPQGGENTGPGAGQDTPGPEADGAADRRQTPEPAATIERRVAYCPEVVPRPVSCADAVRIARDVAARHGLETGLVVGVMRVESGFVANAISPATAVGLMQVMPASGRQAGCGDLFAPDENADCGARILAAFLRHYKGNLVLALSGYNAGHGMPDRARKETRTPKNFRYVEDVLRARARFLRHGCKEWD